jgi:hypothetical protein
MIGDGLGRRHPRRLGGLNFDDEVPNERLDLLSPMRHPFLFSLPKWVR